MSEETLQSPEDNKVEKATPQEGGVVSFIKTIIFIVVGVIFIRVTLIEAYRIPSGSMIPTLQIGDQILVTKLNYNFQLPFLDKPVWGFSTPDRGDVVVFTRPDDPKTILEDDSEISIIKRVLAVGGDTVEVRGMKVLINGKEVTETDYKVWWTEGGVKDFGPTKVPEGHIFLMGDNRDSSKDSRFWTEPFLPVWRVKGRAIVIYWSWFSFKRIGTLIY